MLMASNEAHSQLESDVMEAICRVASCTSSSNRDWTNAVKAGIAKVALARGCKVYANGDGIPGVSGEEWVYDLCACRQDAEGHILEVELVMECEWSMKKGERQWDFQKLMLCPAKIRVFVTEDYTKAKIESAYEDCCSEVRFSSVPSKGDRYLFCGFDKSAHVFRPYFFTKE